MKRAVDVTSIHCPWGTSPAVECVHKVTPRRSCSFTGALAFTGCR
nr:MAG TPA: hypothetical protein [Caudoviricetes sp.]